MTRQLWPWALLLAVSLILGPLWFQNTYCPCDAQASGQSAAGSEANRTAAPIAKEAESNNETQEYDFIPRFTLRDGLSFRTASPDNFSFMKSGALPNLPEKFVGSLQEIANYLKNNPTRSLSLTGLYAGSEINNTDFENLGLGRANSIKDKLIALGAPAASFQLASLLSDDLSFNTDGLMDGGVSWEFVRTDSGAADEVNEAKALEELGNTLKARPITVYFETNQTLIIQTDELQNFLKSAKTYMEKVPGARIEVTGHADSQGTDAINNRLSRGRAQAAKAWLQRNGVSVGKISTSAKGSKSPVADNGTESGRARNRRAEVIIVE